MEENYELEAKHREGSKLLQIIVIATFASNIDPTKTSGINPVAAVYNVLFN